VRFPWQKTQERTTPITAGDLIPPRPVGYKGTQLVTPDTAMRHSAVWACLRLRANLISTLPVDTYRRVDGRQVAVPNSAVLVNPGGDRVNILEWLYSTQVDLDRAGNCFGVITQTDGYGFPARIDLVPLASVTVRARGADIIGYKIDQTEYSPEQIWHEKQYTLPGLHVGLSPVAYGAWTIGEYLSIQEFATDWFNKGGIPAAELKNTARTLDAGEASTVKQYFKSAVSAGDLFVHGSDWEYKMIQAEQTGSTWIEAKQYGLLDIARFFDCPGDLIDAAVSGQAITYATITQRNLQMLIMHLGPAIARREAALTGLTPQPRYVKLNTNALLRMDPAARAGMIKTQIDGRWLAPSEARELEDRAPFTASQIAEFDELGLNKAKAAPAVPAVPAAPSTPALPAGG
jgi:HK97 family phage portal protein